MHVILAPDGPLDVSATLARYRLWGEDPANRLTGDVFRRVLRHEGHLVPYEVRRHGGIDDARIIINVPGARSPAVLGAAREEVRKILGLDFDVPGFYRMAAGDPVLAGLVQPLYGLRPSLTPSVLEMLVGSITAQQVNLSFAMTLRARLVRRYGTPVPMDGETVYAFPEAPVLARARLVTLRSLQFSAGKAAYIREVARALATGRVDPAALMEAPSPLVIETLTALHGLGRWSAEWFIARCLGRGEVCPAGDLAVRKAFAHYYGGGVALDEATIRRRAASWGAHQNLAIHYLLAGLRLTRPATGGAT